MMAFLFFFFSLLLASHHFTLAVVEHSFSPITSSKEGTKKKNTLVAAANSISREGSAKKSKKDMTLRESANKGIHNVPDQLQGPKKRGRSRAPRPPLQRQNRIFNASEHEVPSGPNPIANR
ncbi:hypothetical protein RIF29_26628 [Crotalaria pallida]|uniref:Uncharacterized protein n=1 Tax=Crotalaria pallida TaxID=3830 RepID=A0AAN9EQB4_CROPI